MEILSVQEHIERYYKNRLKDFADSEGVHPQQVTRWKKKGFIVVEGVMYSKRRTLLPPNKI